MRVLVQKCTNASVSYGKEEKEISQGLVLFVGFTLKDGLKEIEYLAKKVVNLRIFEDEQGIMNRSLFDVQGSVLSISQFTLYGDATKGNRPSYSKALPAGEAKKLYELWNLELQKYVSVVDGFFGCDMKVSLINDGPTTIWLEKSFSEEK